MADAPLMVLPPGARRYVARRGHAGQPGAGPRDETCGSCAHVARVNAGARTVCKCALRRRFWTRGPGSDVRLKDAACPFWQAPAPDGAAGG